MLGNLFRRLYKRWAYLTKGLNYVITKYNIEEARRIGVKVGERCRFYSTNPETFSTEPWLIEIGDHVSMTDPLFITHDGGVWVFRDQHPDIELFGRISIGNNVFIGSHATILFNTTIGDNCIIAAGALVKGRVEPNSVMAGVPARRICSIDEYYAKNQERFLYDIRGKSDEEKKAAICQKLGLPV